MRKYQVGDRVVIEYRDSYGIDIKNDLKKHNNVFTITGFYSIIYYNMKENKGVWQDCHIVGIADNDINSRWEILDL